MCWLEFILKIKSLKTEHLMQRRFPIAILVINVCSMLYQRIHNLLITCKLRRVFYILIYSIQFIFIPFLAAKCSGVLPASCSAFTFAPFCNRNSTISTRSIDKKNLLSKVSSRERFNVYHARLLFEAVFALNCLQY